MEEKSILSAAAAFKGWIMGGWVLPMSPRWISAILPCQEPFEESGSRWAQDGYQQSKPIPDKNLSNNLVQLKPLKEHFALLKKHLITSQVPQLYCILPKTLTLTMLAPDGSDNKPSFIYYIYISIIDISRIQFEKWYNIHRNQGA